MVRLARVLLMTIAAACSTLEADDRWAVLIAAERYDQSDVLRPLAFSGVDIRRLEEALIQSGYDPDRVIVLTHDADDGDFVPKYASIVKQLRRVIAETSSSHVESLMVVFAGHGLTINGESYLCPEDARLGDRTDRLLSVTDLSTLVASSGAAQKYVVVDACREEFAALAGAEFSLLTGLQSMSVQGNRPEGLVYFASCLARQRSIEDPELKHGVFLHYFAEALTGLADIQSAGNRDGFVSSHEAFQYASDRTRERSRALTGWEQQPWYEGRATAGLTLVSLTDDQRQKVLELAPAEPVVVSGAALHSQLELTEALYALQAGDIQEVFAKSQLAIELDPSNRMAVRTSAMALQVMGRVPDAVLLVKSINEPLPVRIGNGKVIVRALQEEVAVADGGDVLEVRGVNEDSSQDPWLHITGLRRGGSRMAEDHQKINGYVRLSALMGTTRPVDQVIEFGRSNQQPASIGYYSSGSRAAAALDRWDQVRSTINSIPYAGGYVPSVPYGGTIRGVINRFR